MFATTPAQHYGIHVARTPVSWPFAESGGTGAGFGTAGAARIRRTGTGVGAAVAIMRISQGMRRSAGRSPAHPAVIRTPVRPVAMVNTTATPAADALPTAVPFPTDETRRRSALFQAARCGDSDAFRELCAEMDEALLRAVRHALREEQLEVTASRVRLLVNTVCARAFSQLAEKPADWALYGWMAWLIRLEVVEGCNSRPGVLPAHQGGRHGSRNA
jgi:hypothetical protein